MANINNATVFGRLTRDPELKTTQSGKNVASVSIAVQGFKEEDTSFIDLVFLGRQAEVLTQYCSKGQQIGVTGRLQQRTWEKDGQKRSIIEVVVNDIQLPPKADNVPMTQAQALNGGKDVVLEDISNESTEDLLSQIPFI